MPRKRSASGDYRQIGLGMEIGLYQSETGVMFDPHLMKSPNATFITGVAYTDRDGDRFYDVGEDLRGVRFDPLRGRSPPGGGQD